MASKPVISLKQFWDHTYKLVKSDKVLLEKLLIFAVVLGILQLTIPFAVQAIINRIYRTYLVDPLVLILFLVTFFLIIQAVYLFLRFQLTEAIQQSLVYKLSKSMPEFLLRNEETNNLSHSIRFFEIISLKKTFAKFLSEGIGLVLSLIFGFAILLFYHPFFAVLALFILVSSSILIFVYHHHSCMTSVKECKAKYAIADAMNETILNNKTDAEKMGERVSNYLHARIAHFKLLKNQFLGIQIIYTLSHIILLGIGGTLVLNGQLTVGQLVASELIFSVVLGSLSKSIDYLESYYDAFASIDKISFVEEFPKFRHISGLADNFRKVYKTTKLTLIITPFLLMILPWVQTSEGLGHLTTLRPEERTQQIMALVDGRINRWFVDEGETVKKDQPLVEIIDNDPQFSERLQADRDAALKKYLAAKMAAETALYNKDRQEELFKEGLSSRLELEKAKINYHNLIAKEAEAASSLAKAEVQFSRQQMQMVLAPSDGIIQQLLAGNLASNVKQGEVLAIFVPATTTPAAEIFVDGMDAPLIQPGRKVRLEFEGFPAMQFSGWPDFAFGTFGGKVAAMDSTSSPNGRFRVMVIPTEEEPWPDETILRRGARVKGWVQMNTVPLGYEIWRQFNGFPVLPDEFLFNKQAEDWADKEK